MKINWFAGCWNQAVLKLNRIWRTRRSVEQARRRQHRRALRQTPAEPLESRMLLSATVSTDQIDYAPGSTAVITTTTDGLPDHNFQIGETLQFQVSRTDGIADHAPGNLPWIVTDGSSGFTPYQNSAGIGVFPDTDGRANGQIGTTWFVDSQYAQSTLKLTALGLTSGAVATYDFSDSAIVISSNTNWNAITTGSGINGAPTATDTIVVNNGVTLTINVNNAAAGAVILGNGTTGTAKLAFSTGTRAATLGSLTNNGTATVTFNNANSTLSVGTANTDNSFAGVISGAGNLTKIGTGTWTLSGVNTFTGVTTISDGVLSVATIGNGGVNGNLGAATSGATNLVLGGGTLQYTGADASTDRAFTLTAGTTSTLDITTNNLTMSGAAAVTTGGLTKIGTGTLTLSGTNGYTGLTIVSDGTLEYGASNALSSGGVTVDGAAATLAMTTFSDSVGVVTVANGGTISSTTGVLTGTSYALKQGTVSAILAGAVPLTKTTSGTVTLSGVNTFTGVTTINAGVLSVATIRNGGVAGNLGAASNTASNLVLGGGTLQYTGGNASTTRNFTLTAGTTSTLDITANTLTMSGAAAVTTGGLTKIGTGTLKLSGANEYTGLTTVNGGTLAYGANNALSSGDVTVNAAGTYAIGAYSDTIGTLQSTGSVTSTTGILTIQNGLVTGTVIVSTGNVVLTPTTVYQVNLNGTTAGTNYGQTNVTGTINLGGSELSVSTSLYNPPVSFVIILNDGTDAITGTFAGLPEGTLVQANGQIFRITYHGGDGNDVALLETVQPSVVSINRASPVGETTVASSVSFTATFSDSVTGVDATDFSLVTTGSIGTSPVQVSPISASVYTVTVSGITGAGSLGLNLIDNGTILDLNGNSLASSHASFANQATFATGAGSFFVTLGDLNGDGKNDLVVANNGSDTVSVLLGNGNGTFQTQTTFATGTAPSSATLGDLNGDGKIDLAVANISSNTVSVLLGNGNGTFKTQTTFAAGSYPKAVSLGDLNGDGRIDLAVANYGSDTVSVLLGNGNGTFKTQTTFATGTIPYSVTLGDLNGDGKIDLAVANSGSNSVSVLLGNGNGTFKTQTTFATGTIPYSVTLGDLNGDGRIDLAVANKGSGTVSVLLGNGNGTFKTQATFATGSYPQAVSLGDLNEDGKNDLIVANYGSNTVSVLLGNGNGNFSGQAYTIITPPLVTTQPTSATVTTGAGISFSAAASGSPVPTVQWQVSTDGTNWSDVAGATSSTYSFAPSAADTGKRYHAVFTNAAGSATTNAAILTVNTIPVVSTQPSNTTVITGTTASFTAAASGSPVPTLQWQVSTDGTNWSDIAGATSSTYRFTASAADTGKQYHAVFTNAAGSVTTSAATLTVDTRPSVVSINRTSPAGETTQANSVSFTATFSEPVTGVDATDFSLVTTGSIGTSPVQVSPVSTSVYTVTVSGITGAGSLGLNLIDNGTILDLNGNSLASSRASFANQATFATGITPVSVTLGDLNADGKSDLVVANKGSSNSVSVLLGNGNGTFQTQTTFATGTAPSSATLGDLNGDGKIDLAVANSSSNTVSVLLGNGNGTFQTQATFATGTVSLFVTLGDLNGDGKSDLAVLNKTSATVSVLLGNGDGTFQTQTTFATGTSPYSVTLGDLNGDGKIDLAVANKGSGTVSVLLGNGDGIFQTQTTFATGASPISVTLGDLNGDGKNDLVVANFTSATVSVLQGNGDGTFQTRITFATGTSPRSVPLGDLNGDGKIDLVVANRSSNTVSVLLGNGTGNFTGQVYTLTPPSVTTQPTDTTVITGTTASFSAAASGSPLPTLQWQVSTDGTNWSDIAGATSSTYRFTASAADTGKQYHAVFTNAAGSVTTSAATLTVDTRPSVVSINRTSPAGETTQANSVSFTATFSEPVTGVDATDFSLVTTGSIGTSPVQVSPISASVYTVTVSGITGAGSLGLNLIDNGTILDLNGNSLASSHASFANQATFATGAGSFFVTLGDLNGDGKNDLVVANNDSNTVSVLLGNGDGTFQTQATFDVGTYPNSVTLGDLNADGKNDLVVTMSGYDPMSVLLGNGDGSFQTPTTFATGTPSSSVTLCDLNGDGKYDLVVANKGSSNSVSVLLGNGDGTFQTEATFATGMNPKSVTLGDLNGDGKIDLAVANKGSGTVSVLLGNGDGTFQTQSTFATGNSPYSVKLGDLNGDGKIDLAVVNSDSDTVSVLLGNGDGNFQTQTTFNTGGYSFSMTLGDLNGDGKNDLAVANYGSNTVSVLLGNGDGTFQTPTTFDVGTYPTSVTLGDLNGDGKNDLAVANYGSNTVSVLLGNGNGNFSGQAYTIIAPPLVTTQPSSATVTTGAGISFSAVASGSPIPTVQWQVSTDGTNWSDIDGATSPTYSLTPSAADTGKQYHAVFTNAAGNVTTSAATLTVNTVPVVSTQPSNTTVTAGTNASFSAAATGSPTPTVQWKVSTDGINWTNISGATSATYSFTTSAADTSKQYHAVFTNVAGNVTTSAATLTVNTVPVVTTQPSNTTVTAGASVSFSAAASGSPAPTVQWQVSTDGTNWSNISGATSTTYSFGTTVADNGKQFRAIFTNSVGSVTSALATLTAVGRSMSVQTTYTTTVFTGLNTGTIKLVDVLDVFALTLPTTYTATVNWGDGQIDSNIPVAHPNTDGTTVHVLRAHTYASGGTYRPLITLVDAAGASLTTITSNTATLIVGTDVSNKVSMTRSSPVKNRTTGFWAQTVTMNNISGVDLTGNLDLVLIGLTPGVTLSNATGSLSGGTNPYVRFSTTGLKAGRSVSLVLNFVLPTTITAYNYTFKTFTN